MSAAVTAFELDGSSGLWYRPGANDLRIIEEVGQIYEDIPVRRGDIVLDLGAHIGATSMRLLERGASAVVAVEPDPANLRLLEMNLAGAEADIVAAAVGPLAGTGRLYARRDRPHLSSLLAPDRDRDAIDVKVVTLGELLEAHRPEIVKCDIEFGEYALPELRALPSFVRVLAMEVHVRLDVVFRHRRLTEARLRRRRAAAVELVGAIEAQGFRVVRRHDRIGHRPPSIADATGLHPLTRSIDAIWERG